MVAPLIAVAVRLAAKQVAKKAATKAASRAAMRAGAQAAKQTSAKAATNIVGKTTMQRAGEKAAAQAAKRYYSAAERYTRDAAKVGERTRYGQMLTKAARRVSKLGNDLENADFSDGLTDAIDELIERSDQYLTKATKTKAARGDLLGETLLDGTMQGHRFFAVTKSLWEDASYDERYGRIKNAFGDKSLADIILQIEEDLNINIMKGDINSDERYGALSDEEKMRLVNYIIANYG